MYLTSKLGIRTPSEYEDPFWQSDVYRMTDLDDWIFANVEDKNQFVIGSMNFDSGTGELSWSSPLHLASSTQNGVISILADTVTVADGQFVYVVVPRPYQSTSLVASVGSAPFTDEDIVPIAYRYGNNIYVKGQGSLMDFPAHGPSHVDGTDDVPLATQTTKGLMSAVDKVKIDLLTSLMVQTVFYVSTTGDDVSGDGTIGSPYATVSKALESVPSELPENTSVVIKIANGQYSSLFKELELKIPDTSQITFDGYEGWVDTYAGPYTVDTVSSEGYSGQTLSLSSSPFPVDGIRSTQGAPAFVQMLSGNCTGYILPIFENAADSVTIVKHPAHAAVAAGDTFKIVQAGVVIQTLDRCVGRFETKSSKSNVVFSNIYVSNTQSSFTGDEYEAVKFDGSAVVSLIGTVFRSVRNVKSSLTVSCPGINGAGLVYEDAVQYYTQTLGYQPAGGFRYSFYWHANKQYVGVSGLFGDQDDVNITGGKQTLHHKIGIYGLCTRCGIRILNTDCNLAVFAAGRIYQEEGGGSIYASFEMLKPWSGAYAVTNLGGGTVSRISFAALMNTTPNDASILLGPNAILYGDLISQVKVPDNYIIELDSGAHALLDNVPTVNGSVADVYFERGQFEESWPSDGYSVTDYEDAYVGIAGSNSGIATPFPPHGASHEAGQADEFSLAGLSGLLADPQNAGWLRDVEVEATVPTPGETGYVLGTTGGTPNTWGPVANQFSNMIEDTLANLNAAISDDDVIGSLEKGAANGVATLDAGGHVPLGQLPDSVLGALNYQGTWDASTNTPTLASSTGTKGHMYKVSVAGSTDLDGITDWKVGDNLIFNGTVWDKVDNTESVTSVFGRTGPILAVADDYAASLVTNDSSVTGSYVDDALNNLLSAITDHVTGPASAADNAIARFDSTTGKLIQNSGVLIDDDDNLSGINSMQLELLDPSTVPYSEGKLFYDNVKKTFSGYNDESEMILNFGQEFVIPVYNNTGATIPNGSVVYPTGVFGGRHTVDLADASYKARSRPIAMVTHDIENNSSGYVTRLGSVGGLDTSMFSTSAVLYLSDTTPGAVTMDRPADGSYVCIVGAVKIVDGFDGEISVDIHIGDLTVEVTDQNGFPTDLLSDSTIGFDDGTRTFTISATGTEFHYYQLGDKYNVVGGDSVTIPDEDGLYAIYYDDDTLVYTKNPTNAQIASTIRTKTSVAYVYWNSVQGIATYIGDERHGISMSPATHTYLHFTRGTQYANGLQLTDFDVDQSGDSDAHAQFGSSLGSITDEDYFHTLNAVGSTTGLPIFYKTGAAGIWNRVTQSGFSVYNTGSVSGRPFYNEWTGTAWQLTEIGADNDLMLMHIFATNDIGMVPFAIMGTSQYANLADARAGANVEIGNLVLGTFFSSEFVPVGTVIFQCNDGYANTVKAKVVSTTEGADYVSWLTTELSAGTPPASHDNLQNLYLAQSGVAWGHINDQAQILAGVKTFSSFPVTPSSAPTTDYQTANKKYIDDVWGSVFDATGNANMGNHNITNAKTITFNSVPIVTPSTGVVTCEFDEYQKIVANLNNVSSVTITLNVPNGPGNFVLVVIQGSSTPSTITWATEGTHAIYAPGGSIDIQGGAGERTVVGLFYDGSTWYVTPTPVSLALAS